MKQLKIVMLAITSILFCQFEVFAQWFPTGNFLIGTDFLGSTNAIDLVFKANNIEAFRLNQSTRFAGIGTGWSTTLTPQRTLDVGALSNNPQFRITHTRNSTVFNGIHTDFHTSTNGNMHIVPRSGNVVRAVAIGFIDGTNQVDPILGTRLDVGGATRIRSLPVPEEPLTLLVGYNNANMVNPAVDDKFVGRIDFTNDPDEYLGGDGNWHPAQDNDWEQNGIDVWTGHGLNGFPAGKVAIGSTAGGTLAKLQVTGTVPTSPFGTTGIRTEIFNSGQFNFINFGTWTDVTGGSTANYGNVVNISGTTSANFGQQIGVGGTTNRNVGVLISTSGATNNFNSSENSGVFAMVGNGVTGAFQNFGVYAETCSAQNNYAIYGKACTDPGVNWAGYFNGDVFSTTGVYAGSDENLKTDIQAIENASGILNSINPKSYYFNPEISQLTLSETHQFGFLAQDVEEILPELVKTVETPVKTDSLGNVLLESMTFKAIRYNDFIPILVAAFQEQNAAFAAQAGIIEEQTTQLAEQAATIQALQDQMSQVLESVQAMQTKTNNCCQQNGSSGFSTPLEHELDDHNDIGEMKLAQNVPNPFADITRIDFELPNEAQIKLEITDVNGRSMEQLIDGQMSAGLHTIQWDGSRLAPGVYFYSLYANGKLITKKMIKR